MRLLQSLALMLTVMYAPSLVPQDPARPVPAQAPSPTPSPTPSPSPPPLPPPSVRIDDYRAPAGRIIGAALTSNKAYERLSYLTDRIGHRLSGSKNLERAIAWAIAEMTSDVLDNVHAEKVMVPHWVRGEESLEQHRLSVTTRGLRANILLFSGRRNP